MRTLLYLVVALIVGIIAPVYLLGATAQSWLFAVVSYTNSAAFDHKLYAMRSRSQRYNTIFVGSSEVRWGIDPIKVDQAFAEVAGENFMNSFNFGVDGFSPGLLYPILDQGDVIPDDGGPRVIVLGLNFAESIGISRLEYSPGACGALQQPILTSPFALDRAINIICEDPDEVNLSTSLLRQVPLFRYRKAIRSLLVGQESPGLSPDITAEGFHPHPPASSEGDYYGEFNARQPQMRIQEPERYEPLPAFFWEAATSEGGFLDTYAEFADERGWTLVFLHLPTNPYSFDTFDKVETVETNVALMEAWAARSGGVFIDLGVKREYDRNEDFADFRHLSGRGAEKFSLELGRALAQEATVVDAVRQGHVNLN